MRKELIDYHKTMEKIQEDLSKLDNTVNRLSKTSKDNHSGLKTLIEMDLKKALDQIRNGSPEEKP